MTNLGLQLKRTLLQNVSFERFLTCIFLVRFFDICENGSEQYCTGEALAPCALSGESLGPPLEFMLAVELKVAARVPERMLAEMSSDEPAAL